MMKLLLDNKSPLDATDIDGMTALHHGMSEISLPGQGNQKNM
jgi:26S proteasome non-ATPase regulatory subunit 10